MRNPTTLLKDAWGIFTSNPALFVKIYAIPAVVTFLYTLYVEPFEKQGFAGPETVLTALALGIIMTAVNIFASIALTFAVANTTSNFSDLFAKAREYFWKYIWVSILTTLAVMLGFILLIIPGIIFAVWFSFAYFILLFENTGGVDSLKQSRAYVKGKWWAVFGRFVFLALIAIAISIVAGIIGGIVGSASSKVVETAITVAANFILVPLAVAYMYLMYRDISSGEQRTDLETPDIPSRPPEQPNIRPAIQ